MCWFLPHQMRVLTLYMCVSVCLTMCQCGTSKWTPVTKKLEMEQRKYIKKNVSVKHGKERT